MILTEPGNFPTDLYIAQGVAGLIGDVDIRLAPADQIAAAIDEQVALVMLTHIHYKTGARHDMAAITRRAHEAGALALWDLSHSSRDAAARGSQVSFAHPDAYPIMRALIERGVIGDFRAPDILRFGFTPLYVGFEDVGRAADTLFDVLSSGIWRSEQFRTREKVT